jgi:hypothetical protein
MLMAKQAANLNVAGQVLTHFFLRANCPDGRSCPLIAALPVRGE